MIDIFMILVCSFLGNCDEYHEQIHYETVQELKKQCESIGGNWLYFEEICDKTIMAFKINSTDNDILNEPDRPDWCQNNANWDGEKCIEWKVTFDNPSDATFVDKNLQAFFEQCEELNGRYLNLPSKCILPNGDIRYY